MKKTLFYFLIICSITAKAQFKLPLYLRAEMNSSNVKNSDSRIQKGASAINVGVGAEVIASLLKSKKGNYLAFNPSISYLPTGYKTINSTYKVKVNYISVNLPITYFINAGNLFNTLFSSHSYGTGDGILFFLGGGAYYNFATSGKFMLTSIDDYKTMSFGNGVNDNRKSTDAGMLIKFGLKTSRIIWGLQQSIGSTNVIPSARITGSEYIKTKDFVMYLSFKIGKK